MTGLNLEPIESAVDHESGNGNGVPSLIDRMRDRITADTASDRLKLPVPSWRGDLVAEYAVIDKRDWPHLNPNTTVDYDAALAVNSDILIRSCRALYFRNDHGDLEQVAARDEGGASPYALIGERLGLDPATTVRERLMYVFKDNHVSLNAHGVKVFNWMQDTTAEVEGALGEA